MRDKADQTRRSTDDVVAPERVLPHDLDAERALLGSIIEHGPHWQTVASIIGPTDFFRDAHRRIWEAIARLIDSGSPVDFVLLRSELRRVGDEDEVGGPAYISGLLDGGGRAANVEWFARVVREKSRLRQVIYAANAAMAEAYDAERSASDIAADGVRKLLDAGDEPRAGIVSFSDALKTFTDGLDSERGALVPTGFIDVDDVTGGFERKKLTIVAARPSVGKTSFVLAAADKISERGVDVGFLTLEMEPDALAGAILSAHAGVSGDLLRRKIATDRQWTRVAASLNKLDAGKRIHFVSEAHTLTQVQAWSRRLVDECGAQVIVLDYLQLMGDPAARDRQQEIAYFSRALKRTAKDLDVAMVVLSQLSRASESRSDKRPQLADLRESGALEQDADLVLLLFREEMHKPRDDNAGVAEVIIAKNRQGPTGVAKLAFMKETARFENLAYDRMV